MAVRVESISYEGEVISEDLFGGNILAPRGTLDGDGQYHTAIEDLGVTTLRYPGGSYTEKSFDINNPDAETVVDASTGEVQSWIALTDFFSYAVDNDHSVSIVIPTRFNLSEGVDDNGNRLPDFDEDELRAFIRDVATGEYGTPNITAFEIGNEYWHSGQMNSVEYGRLAGKMIDVIDDELTIAAESHPEAADMQITVQMGENWGDAKLDTSYENMAPEQILTQLNSDFGLNLNEDALYNGGDVDWGYVNNKIIVNELEQVDALDDVDGVIAHVYSLGETNEFSRTTTLETLQDTWLDEYPDLDIHVTEWNMRGVTSTLERNEDYGLHQAEEMLNIMEEFVRVDVDFAQVWPLIQNTDNALNLGHSYGETNAPGAMFRMMAENLPGKVLLDLNPDSERGTEAEFEHISVHAFAGPSELVLYVTPTSHDGVTSTDLDLSNLFTGFDGMQLTILGVQDGTLIGSNRSAAELEEIDPENAYSDGFLEVHLDPAEILQVVVTGVIPTDELAPYVTQPFEIEEIEPLDDAVEGDFDIPFVVVPEDDVGSDEYVQDADDDDDDDFGAGMAMLLAAVPLLGLLALAG